MEGDEHMNEVPSENSNLGRDSLEKEKIFEDEKEDLQDGLKLSVVTEEVSGGLLAENGCISLADGSLKRSLETVGTSVSGAKRARITVDEDQPSVHFTYNSLTRASRQKLQELLQKWSEWHAKHVSSSNVRPIVFYFS